MWVISGRCPELTFPLFSLPDAYEGKTSNIFSVAISQYITLVLEGCAGLFIWKVSWGSAHCPPPCT